MNRYVLPAGAADQRVPIGDPVGIYRLGNGSYTIVAETADRLVDLGVKDATVSRKQGGQPPVELAPTSRGISVRNHGSTNPVTLRTNLTEQQLSRGETATVTDDCRIEVGIGVELQATVEREDSPKAADAEKSVSPARHAHLLAERLRTASDDSVTAARKAVSELESFLASHPLDDEEYDRICEKLNRISTRLETKTRGLHHTETLDTEWQRELALVSDRIERLYQ